MRRVLLVAASLAAVLGLGGSSFGAGGTDWKNLKYMLYEVQDELITTDGSWENARVVAPCSPGRNPLFPRRRGPRA